MPKRSAQISINFQKPASISELVEMENLNFPGSPLYYNQEKLEKILKDDISIFAGAYFNGKLVGCCIGRELQHYWPRLAAVEKENVSPEIGQHTTFIDLCECMPQFQRIGLGTRLFIAFTKAAKEMGFCYASAHFRDGLSYNTAKKRLSELLVDIPAENHLGSGETYHFVVGRI